MESRQPKAYARPAAQKCSESVRARSHIADNFIGLDIPASGLFSPSFFSIDNEISDRDLAAQITSLLPFAEELPDY